MPRSRTHHAGGMGGTKALVSEGATSKCKLCFCAALSIHTASQGLGFPNCKMGMLVDSSQASKERAAGSCLAPSRCSWNPLATTESASTDSELVGVGKGQREHRGQLSVDYSILTAPGASVSWLTSPKTAREVSRKEIKAKFYLK